MLVANLSRGEMQYRALFERADDRAGDRDFEPIQNPGNAERDDNERVEPRPGQSVEPRRDVGLDDQARVVHDPRTLAVPLRSRLIVGSYAIHR